MKETPKSSFRSYHAGRCNHLTQQNGIPFQTKARLILLFFLCVFFLSVVFVFHTNATQEHCTYKYYTSIQVQEGDSLWSIADTYFSEEYHDRDALIREIKILNHIEDDCIHAGKYLTVPYYSATLK